MALFTTKVTFLDPRGDLQRFTCKFHHASGSFSYNMLLLAVGTLAFNLLSAPSPVVLHPRAAATMAVTEDATVTGYLAKLEGKVAAMAAQAGRPVPARCIDDACLPLSEYISVLEAAAVELEAFGAVVPTGAANNIIPIGKATSSDGSLSLYLSKLETKVEALCARYDVPMPQQCNAEMCMDVQEYIELLEETSSQLEQQWQAASTSSDFGSAWGRGEWDQLQALDVRTADRAPEVASALALDGSLTGYLSRLEAKVEDLTSKLGAAAPTRCVGDACLDLQTYVAMLEESVVTLEKQWATAKSGSW